MSVLLGLGAGLASAVLFYSAGHGGPLLNTLLLLLTPLPSLLAAFGWGWLPASIGGFAGAVAIGLFAGPTLALGYFLALSIPVVLISYLAYLSRAGSEPDAREWYPAGRLLAAMALYGGALPVMVLPLIGGSYDALKEPLADVFQRVSTRTASDMGMRPLTQQQIENLAELFVAALPAALAAYWLAIFSLNVYLSGRIAHASGRLARDWPDIPAIAYPPGFGLLVPAALAASYFGPGIIGVTGTSFTGSLLFSYLLAGLALMHFIARGRAPWILWAVYAALVLFEPYTAVALATVGLLEPALQLRKRFGSPPPST